MTVEEYINSYTRSCSNQTSWNIGEPIYYCPWLTPDHARVVAQIAKDEVTEKACLVAEKYFTNYLPKKDIERVINNFKEELNGQWKI